MTASTELVALNLTAAEFKAKIIDTIKNSDVKAELLRQIVSELPTDKHALFESYHTNNVIDPISDDKYEWERKGGSYFALHLHMAEKNFCLKRLEHLIQVKSYLTEREITGFSRPISSSDTSPEEAKSTKENTMKADFSSVDLTGFTPSNSLSNSVNSDDLSLVRIALFMEMNDKCLSNKTITQAIAWVLSKYPTLFVDYEENAYSQKMVFDTAHWNKDYYHMQKVYASGNFSLERIHHMLTVREHVFTIKQDNPHPAILPDTPPHKAMKQTTSPQQQQPSTGFTQRTEPKPESNILKSLLLIGGVAAAIALIMLAVIV